MASSGYTQSGTIFTLERGKNYADSLLTSLAEQQEQNSLTDFSLHIGHNTLHAHKCVLKASSEYFRALLDSGMAERQSGEVNLDSSASDGLNLDSLDFDGVKTAIDYMYGCSIQVDMEKVIPLIMAVDYFQLKDLKEKLGEMITDCIILDNCIDWYHMADKYNVEKLKQVAKEMIRIEFSTIAFSDEFLDLESSFVQELIHVQHDIPIQADTVLKACINWIMVNVTERKIHFTNFAKYIDFRRCSTEYLKYVLDSYQDLQVVCDYAASQLSTRLEQDIQPTDHAPTKQSILLCSGSLRGMRHEMNGFVYEMDISTNDVSKVAELPSYSFSCTPTLCSMPQGIFGLGDKDSRIGYTHQYWVYNKYSRQVKELCSMPWSYTECAGAICLANKVYLIGGRGEDNGTLDVLDLSTNEWSPGPPLPCKPFHPKVAAVGHVIYVLHEEFPHKELLPLQCFDTRTESWSYGASLPPEISSARESVLCAVGVSLFCLALNQAKYHWARYDIDTTSNTWIHVSQPYDDEDDDDYDDDDDDDDDEFPILSASRDFPLLSAAPLVMGDKILFCGGTKQLLTYHVSLDKWTYCDSPPVMKELCMSFSAAL